MIKWAFAYKPSDPAFRLMFSKDSRFVAALDGNTVTVWNVEDGSEVLATRAGARFIGYWRIGAQHFGLLSSYQYYDLVNSVIELPDGFRYAQPSKDALTAVAPGGDWAYRVPDAALNRTDYPIKLVNLHTSEKREVDVGYNGVGAVAVDGDATRVAADIRADGMVEGGLWDARRRARLGAIPPSDAHGYYFSRALGAVVIVGTPVRFYGADDGVKLFAALAGDSDVRSVADDPHGRWFAVATGDTIKIYRGVNNPAIGFIADHEVNRPAPATSH
jgi:hypothetical protein